MARFRVDNQQSQHIANRTQQTKTECAKREVVMPERTERDREPRSFNRNFAERAGLDLNLAKTLLLSKFGVTSKTAAVIKPSAERIEKIAEKYAPILVLPKGQYNLPADSQKFIENSRLREDVPAKLFPFPRPGKDKQIGDNTNSDKSDNFNATRVGNSKNEREFLDLNNDMRGRLGSTDAPIFYEFKEGKNGKPPTLTYHVFYPYNDAPKSGPIRVAPGINPRVDLNHEGDWERVTYELDSKTLKPKDVLLSAHNGGTRVSYKDLQKDSETGRRFVYAAGGSHANYAKPGTYALTFGAKDQTITDRNRDGKINSKDGAVFFDTGRNLKKVTSQPWYPKNNTKGLHWGEIGETKHSSGPQGPSRHKGAVEVKE